jgi:inorganic pyrophosphatase
MSQRNLWNLMSVYSRAHPWHGVDIGENAPEIIHCYIEIVPTDTVKFELDKDTGLLKADRPQKYSNYCPSLYGLVPRTYAGKRVGDYCGKKVNRTDIQGDGDPLDICVLSEKEILRGDILVTAIPIGGMRAIDGNEADDKIIAVLKDDLVYKDFKDIQDCPQSLIDRLRHYFLTYKDFPDDYTENKKKRKMEIPHVYGREEAQEIIRLSQEDYADYFNKIKERLKISIEEESF